MNAVLLWCRLYTAGAPEAARERRREELAAHLGAAGAAGVPASRLLAEAVRGSIDDLRWCSEERRVLGMAPLSMAPTAASTVAVVCMVVIYGLSLFDAATGVVAVATTGLLVVAVAILVVSYVDQALRRRRPDA